MNRPMRKQERRLSDEDTLELLRQGEYGVLSMSTPENEGYGVPISYAYAGDAIYFHCATEGAKLDFLRAHPHASFCVVGKTEVLPAKFSTRFESAIAAGTITEAAGDDKRKGLLLLVEKYSPDYLKEGKAYIDRAFDTVIVLKMNIESLTGKARK
ncbi:pyridoxamine 5'-phosphate oxidase family protein [Prolixibacter sp. NT017]|uniref:pyridoxamine 5'-phosphate oxidase family protein n=1 Tax=Prolixibacter sp. NT017 TaxID=2652390 RepID=UPI001286E788|nr:pyridoxamine 5'-phosphate oxidase family protein [Prolixibacter sp. NT017]GET25943.1 MFS transporter [Prolixibacter sp. NT017]